MYKATFQSTHFTFEAYGETEKVALASIKVGLSRHGAEYGIEPDWWHECEGDIYTFEITLGSCYRDNEQIKQYTF
jgi:hypothetical protein